MARRKRRNSGNGISTIICVGILLLFLYFIFPKNKDNNNDVKNNVEGYDAVVFVIGNVKYSPVPSLQGDKNIKKAIEEVFYNTEDGSKPNVQLFSAAGDTKSMDIPDKYLNGPAANKLASNSNLEDLIKGIEKTASNSPTSAGADYFSGLIEALEYAKQFENPLVIIYGSGLSDTGMFNFAFDNLISNEGNEDKLVENILGNDKRFENKEYNNITVNWYGVGQTVGEQPELKEWKKSVENIYAEILEYFGISYKFYPIKVSAKTKNVDTDYDVNMTYPEMTEGYQLSLNERYLAFYPDTAELINQKEVENLLKGVAQKLKLSSGYKINLIGYQTVCAKTNKLSLARANTIKQLLIKLGVDPNIITTDGVAGPPDDRLENPRCGNTGVAVEHRTVILKAVK